MFESDNDLNLNPLSFFQKLHKKSAVFFLSLIGIIVFFNGLFSPFVMDDEDQLLNNGLVHSIGNFFTFFTGSTFDLGGSGRLLGLYYKPLMSVAFATIYSIVGVQPLPFHFIQLILHIANAFLVFIFFRYFFKDGLSFFLAVIFLIHPINQETVIYISDLQDILFFFFGMIALILSRKGFTTPKRIFLICLMLLLSMLSKETGILFIPIILFFQFVIKKRFYFNRKLSLSSIPISTQSF